MLHFRHSLTCTAMLPWAMLLVLQANKSSHVMALSNSDIPSACHSQCDATISLLNSCGLESSGSNRSDDNAKCFCQNTDKSGYNDCTSCINDHRNDNQYDGNNDNDSDNGDNSNNYNGNNDDYNDDDNNDDSDGDDDNNNDSRKRAVHFGRAGVRKTAPGVSKMQKRDVLSDLLNLDNVICTVNGVVGDVTSLAVSLVTDVLGSGPTPQPRPNRDSDNDVTLTTTATVTYQNSATAFHAPAYIAALSLAAIIAAVAL